MTKSFVNAFMRDGRAHKSLRHARTVLGRLQLIFMRSSELPDCRAEKVIGPKS